ncbi:MAG: enoyl-CoA hydratase-related protein, partial [Myxococcota bacterium]
VDAITGSPMGHPKSASFRTADMVGIDTFVHVSENCYAALVDDEDREVFQIPDFMKHMVAKKLLGHKTKGGFYKKTKEGITTLDPSTLEYRPKAGDPEIKKFCKSLSGDARSRVKKLVEDNGPAGAFARKLLSKTLSYAARRMGEIAEDISAVDDAMRWGYNWELGPFETWDALGFRETAERMKKEGHALPAWIDTMLRSDASAFYRGNEVWNPALGRYQVRKSDARNTTLMLLRGEKPPVLSNSGAVAHDIGDGVLAVTFKTKANSLDDSVIALMGQAIEEAEKNYRAMLLFNEGEHFCVGANLFALVMAANQKQWEGIRNTVQTLQKTMQRVKYASVPVVAAPYGMALGGGLEVCLCADAVQAAAETYCGLVEVGVGLIPGGAGNLNLLWRALETTPEGAEISPHPYITQVFKNIAMAKVATSAEEAKFFGYFRHSDGVSFDRDRQLSEAKARAIGMAESGYHPPSRRSYRLAGEDGVATLSMMVDTLVAGGYASAHDALIARKLAVVLSGGAGGAAREVTEDEILELEAEAFVSLCGEQKSIDRMQHMLMHNKPLRN